MAGDPSNTHATQPPLHIYRPIPRRNFGSFADSLDSPTHDYAQATPPSAIENRRPSDFLAQLNARLLRTYNSRFDDSEEQEREYPPRNKSLLNLNSSTLSGIYDATSAGDQSVAETPWGTGAETPRFPPMSTEDREPSMRSQDSGLTMKKLSGKGAAVMEKPQGRKRSHSTKQPRQGIWKYAVLIGKLVSLFVFGIIYGVIVSHLHESRQFPRVPAVEGVDHSSHLYLASWGFFGVALGSLLPYVDLLWEAQRGDSETEDNKEGETPESPLSEQINEVVRSVAAFVGIAFAIRRLPWQSTLQLTLTLALVNPALWYILDRSKPGLSVSLTVTSVLTSFIFLSNPDVLPSPSLPVIMNATAQLPPMAPAAQELFVGMVTYESLAVVTWVGSVLFCSCVCFGSIGRRLAVLEESGWKR